MSVRMLDPKTVPENDWHRFRFKDQGYVLKSSNERTLAITCRCDTCKRYNVSRRVTDIRSDYKKNKSPSLVCAGCRVGRKYETKDGYVVVYFPDHPNAHRNGSLYEHVYVMSNSIGRPLAPGENVHHLNGARNDNRVENLQLWSTVQPSGQRIEDKIRWAIELKDAYPDVWDQVLAGMKEA